MMMYAVVNQAVEEVISIMHGYSTTVKVAKEEEEGSSERETQEERKTTHVPSSDGVCSRSKGITPINIRH